MIMDVMRRTSRFGLRTHPVTGAAQSFHNGTDYAASSGTPLRAVADGVVRVSTTNRGGPTKGYGHYIILEHEVEGIGKFCTLYAHLVRLGLPVGRKVKKGDIVAHSGNTGSSTGPHLHFEVRMGAHGTPGFWNRANNGMYLNAVDPEPFLARLEKLKKEDEMKEKTKSASKHFVDIEQEWIAEAADYCASVGITHGRGDGVFDPHAPITRGEVIVLIYRAIKFLKGE